MKATNFETATERPLSIRAAERERREQVLAEKESRSAKRALELELRRSDYRDREEKRRKLQEKSLGKPAAADDAESIGGDLGERKDPGEEKGRATTLVLQSSQTSSQMIPVFGRERCSTGYCLRPKRALEFGTIS
jgi:hypothetical protein